MMKKTILLLAILALAGTAIADTDPIAGKISAYNAIRNKDPDANIMEMGLLLRGDPGTVSASSNEEGQSCVICNLKEKKEDHQAANDPASPDDPTRTAATILASILATVPAGLGNVPGPISRTTEGTGAAWISPGGDENYQYSGYESLYQSNQTQYDADVINIRNAYMDPNNGRLTLARNTVLNAVESDVAAYTSSAPTPSAKDRANFEAERIQANSGLITTLAGEYQNELNAARAAFDARMEAVRHDIDTPDRPTPN